MKIELKASKVVGLLIVALFLILAILPTQTLAARPVLQASGSPLANQTWVRLGGPLGGLGYDIRMRPDNPDIMYVTEAFSGVHISMDGGRSWTPSNEGIDAHTGPSGDAVPVLCLTIDPNNYDTIWIGTQNLGSIYRSTDSGATWEKRSTGIEEPDGLTFRGITVMPDNSDIVYAAAEISSWSGGRPEQRGREFDKTEGVVYKTIDGGQSWEAIWRGNNLARYIWIDPNDHDVIYVSTGIFDREAANSDAASNMPGGEGVLKSTDGGKTWKNINNGLGNPYVGSLFMHPTDPNILLAATGNNAYLDGGGVYLTTDGGENWKHVVGEHVTSVEFALSDPDIAYAAGDGFFYRSEDGGQTWKTFVNKRGRGWGPEGIRPGFPIDFQVDPKNPYSIFVNNYGGGNFLSEDGGETWNTSSVGYTGADLRDVFVDPNNPSFVLVNGRSGPFMSRDGGVNWQGINPLDAREIAEGARVVVDPSNPNHILLSSAHWGWVYESTDGALNWSLSLDYGEALHALPESDTNKKFQGAQAITFAPSDPSIVYAGLGVWRCAASADASMCDAKTILSLLISQDGGHSWRELKGIPFDGLTVTEIVVHPSNSNIAWVSTAGGGIFRTDDMGKSWTAVNHGVKSLMVMDLILDPSNPNIMYAGIENGGVVKSLDGGATWKSTSMGMDANEPIRSLAISPVEPNVVYAGSYRSGVFISQDGGERWQLINSGLHTRVVTSLAITGDGDTLYAGTTGEGVFRLSTHGQEYFDALKPASTPTPQPSPTSPPSLPPSPTLAPQEGLFIMDGKGTDWADIPVSGTDPSGDQAGGSPDLGEVRAINDRQYFYLYIQLHEPGVTDHYDLLMDINGGNFDYQLSFWPDRNEAVFAEFPVTADMNPLAGVTAIRGDVIEVSMPLSAVGGQPILKFFLQTFLGNGTGDQTGELTPAPSEDTGAVPPVASASPTTPETGDTRTTGVSTTLIFLGSGVILVLIIATILWMRSRKKRS